MNTLTVGKASMSNSPAPKVEPWFRKALVKLGGKTPWGDPVLKLVWGQDQFVTAYGEKRMKYLAVSAVVKTGEDLDVMRAVIVPRLERIDIGIPRWFIEEWYPPAMLAPDYDEAIFGTFPEHGTWKQVFRLETADCEYRSPDRECLAWVQQAWRERQEARKLHEQYEKDHPYWREQANKDMLHAQDLAQEQKEAELKDRFKSLLAPHMRRLTHEKPRAGRGF